MYTLADNACTVNFAGVDIDLPVAVMPAAPDHGWLAGLQPISLDALNARASMLVRRDNKYVLRQADFRAVLAELGQHFDVLEIDGKREFSYHTRYFDDPEHTSYFDHHRGRRQRCKVRMRKYVDAGLCFVEVKLKDKRGITVKKRLDHPLDKYGELDAVAWAHIRGAYRDLYGRSFKQDLVPVLDMAYRRVTLVARRGGERMTIDRALVFKDGARSQAIGPGLLVVETKSRNANGIADKILRSHHQHPTKHCSKYCAGMAALKKVRKHNNFLTALRRLQVVPRASLQVPAVVVH